MKKKSHRAALALLGILLLGGCGDKGEGNRTPADSIGTEQAQEEMSENADTDMLSDGTYTAEFSTDSTMFRVNEACDGKGTLTVKEGEMTIHVSLVSKNIVNLYPGLAEDASKEGAQILMPTEDTVTYSDGMTEVVYGFDIPVPALDTEFDMALIGTKGTWYDHKVKVSNPKPTDASSSLSTEPAEALAAGREPTELADGSYSIEVTLDGGTGRAGILSPVSFQVIEGKALARIQWDSPNYDYMLVDGEKYLPVNEGGDSVFEIPILSFDEPMEVIGDTLAMSTPHEVEYTITFHSDTIRDA